MPMQGGSFYHFYDGLWFRGGAEGIEIKEPTLSNVLYAFNNCWIRKEISGNDHNRHTQNITSICIVAFH